MPYALVDVMMETMANEIASRTSVWLPTVLHYQYNATWGELANAFICPEIRQCSFNRS
jgi:hypothetical protein